eukprot:6472481-Pyramimonas_sp.AAC.1
MPEEAQLIVFRFVFPWFFKVSAFWRPSAPRRPKRPPRPLQDSRRGFQQGPKTAHDGPKRVPE